MFDLQYNIEFIQNRNCIHTASVSTNKNKAKKCNKNEKGEEKELTKKNP